MNMNAQAQNLVWSHRYARLIRFVGPGVLPPRVVASLKLEENLLLIDRGLFGQLDACGQRLAFRTTTNLELA